MYVIHKKTLPFKETHLTSYKNILDPIKCLVSALESQNKEKKKLFLIKTFVK